MCGIAGILSNDREQFADAGVLDHMLDSIVHRGPDDSGSLIDNELAMGMRRLSIIDLDTGRQPIFDEEQRFGVIFNGEIYNYVELRRELQQRGHRFRTQGDTEVIVHLYEEFGANCLDQLRGMFSVAIWDNHKRELFIARDRLGIKPLYYAITEGQLVFASEIKALLQHPTITAELDLAALSEYLSLKFVPAPRTMFRGIKSLPPGHCLTARAGDVDVRRYWDLSFESSDFTRTEEDCAEELAALLREAVRLRLRSDVPFGAFLSGGLDSSMIVALMSEQLSSPVKTFSVGFKGGRERDELPYAREVAERFGCDHHEIVVCGSDFVEQAEKVIYHLDQPIADQATMATHLVAKLASEHVKMVLTGEGGDELFAGYARYRGEQLSPVTRFLPRFVGRAIRVGLPYLPGMRRPKIAMRALTIREEAARFASWFPLFNEDAKRELVRSNSGCGDASAAEVFRQQLNASDARLPLDRMLYADTKLWLPDYLLLRGDKLTMANSIEARVPLLDHKVVEFAGGLPPHMKLRGSTRKYLLKRVARDLLPDSIIHRKKQGFPIPIDKWLRHEAKPLVREFLSEHSLRQRGLFNPQVVQTMIQRHESRYADYSTEIWGLVSIEMWMRRFVDQPVSGDAGSRLPSQPITIPL